MRINLRFSLIVLCLSLFLSSPVRAGDDELLDILLKNKTITQQQYDSMKDKKSRVKQDPLRNGLRFESQDGNFKYAIGGRLQLDAAWYGDDVQDLGNGTKARRARMYIKGLVYKQWGFETEYDFADDAVNVKDAFISYKGFESSIIKIGQFKESFSLEELTSSRFITFMERAAPNTFAPGRNLGIGFMTHGGNWTFAVGAFGEDIGNERTDDEGYGFSGRITYAPWHEKTRALHLGIAGAFREPDELSGAKGFDSRPESDVTTVKLVDTGDITGTLNYTTAGVESALVYGPFSLQGEYMWVHVERQIQPNPDFYGGYIYGSWFLTGESRNYSARNGKFGRVSPKKNLGEGGWGALEVAARYSNLDLNDGALRGGEMNNVTFGLNWHPNPRIRFMANYIKVNTDVSAGDDDPEVIQFRAQVDF